MQTHFDSKRTAAPERPKIHRLEVYWTAVTYKAVVLYGLLILLIIVAGMYVVMPERYAVLFRKITSSMGSSDPNAMK